LSEELSIHTTLVPSVARPATLAVAFATSHGWQLVAQPPDLQLWPQAPQLPALLFKLISQPFEAVPSQSAKPLTHDATLQVPFAVLQAAFASLSEQALQVAPDAPQVPAVSLA
jgi:hypothetical protein